MSLLSSQTTEAMSPEPPTEDTSIEITQTSSDQSPSHSYSLEKCFYLLFHNSSLNSSSLRPSAGTISHCLNQPITGLIIVTNANDGQILNQFFVSSYFIS